MEKGKRKYVCDEIECIVCGYRFTPYTRKAMYCSNACKQLAYRENIRRVSRLKKEKTVIVHSYERGKENNPEKWMDNYMKRTNKTLLKEISKEDFWNFPQNVREFYQEGWIYERKVRETMKKLG